MAVRTNSTDVSAIMNTNLSSDQIDVYISSASLLIDANLTAEGYSTTLLTEIERWLVAHLISITRERQASKVKIGDVSETYGKVGMRLDATTYGQHVLLLDSHGKLKQLGQEKVRIEAVPTQSDSEVYDL